MKLLHHTEIDLLAFFLTGKFDGIKPGQSTEWIEANFADPDHKSDMGGGISIWNWGAIEFHFDRDMLYLIWCDRLKYVADCPALDVRRGWLERPSQLSLRWVVAQLNQQRADYRVIHDVKLGSVQLRVLASGVEFHFEPTNTQDDGTPSDRWRMQGFGLSHPDYRRP